MKKLLALLLLAISTISYAGNNYLCIKNPDNPGSQGGGTLSNVNIEVTPKGIYAQVDLVFNISDPSGYPGQWEGVLCFDLPAGSFIHDSWLWLDDTTIISADIVERNLAIKTYTGIVRRKRDPSLLLKNLSSNYRLNVYPIRSDYQRKVKITYSTPFVWVKDKATIELPTALLATSSFTPGITLKVNTTAEFKTPSFLNLPFNNFVISQSAGSFTLSLPAYAYYDNSRFQVSDIHLAFSTNNSGNALVFTYPINSNEGVYQFVAPAAVSPAITPRNIVYMFNQNTLSGPQKYSMIYTLPEMVRLIKNSIVRDLSPEDSFNIFYSDGASIVNASPVWRAADSAGISAVLNGIKLNNNTQYPQLRELLREALPYAKLKPDAQCVLISCDPSYNSANYADTMFENLKAFIGGFTNRIDVINNSFLSYYGTGSEYFYSKLCKATGGQQYKSKGTYFDSYTFNYSSDIDADACLRQICQSANQASNTYSIELPVNGIAWSEYEPAIAGKYNPAIPYARIGRYYGTWPGSGTIQMKYIGPGGLQTNTASFTSTNPGTLHTYKSWLYNKMNELQLQNSSGSYNAVLVDSSIRNRVLFDVTAFLALETGDTLKTSVDGIAVAVPTPKANTQDVLAFPNPFTNAIAIRCPEEMERIQITDISGRLVWETRSISNKEVIWNGKNVSGAEVSPGIYLVRIVDKNGNQFTAKVEKK